MPHSAPKAVLLFTLLAATACAPQAARTGQSGDADGGRSAPGRTLVAAVRVEPGTPAPRPLREGGVAVYLTRRMFNAELAQLDGQGRPQLYLAERLAELNTDSWRVFPDGRMETMYVLKPNLTWHDGTRFSAEDFAFAHRVYSTPQLGLANAVPFNAMEEVLAPDERTLIVRWRRPYPDAGHLAAHSRGFPPLPRHVLADDLQPDQVETFPNHPYWTREYLGLGPYKLERWEPGAFIDAVAFDNHTLGRAKIERIKMLFMPDANTALSNILAGEVHLSADTSLRLEQAATLKREWGPRQAGTVLEHANQWRATNFQLRAELATPRALLDARIRKALAHAVDKQAISDSLYHGGGIFSDFIISSNSQWGPAVDPAIVRYPLDLRRSEQLMAEAGFRKGGDGMYSSLTEGRFVTEAKTDASADNVAETSILASGWRQTGFDMQEATLPIALAQDGESRATFPSLFTNNTSIGEPTAVGLVTPGIPRPETRWVGTNRGGYSNSEYDRLAQAFSTTLDPNERAQQIAQMARIFTEDLPSISLFFRTQPWAFVSGIRGLQVVAPESNMAWNIQEWEFR